MSLGPAMIRRENALNKLLPAQQFVKLNPDALLRMDPMTRAETINLQVAGRVLGLSEARLLEDRPALTDEQKAEFDRFWPPKPPSRSPTAQPLQPGV
jgi:hypothetical protein